MLEDGEIAGHLSEVMWHAGKQKEARALVEQAIKKDPDHKYLKTLRERFAR